MSTIIFSQEQFRADLWREATPLLIAHWREIAHFQDIQLDPDLTLYHAAQEAGMVRCYTARDAGVLVGYAIFFVRTNPHYRRSLQATQDVLFLDPSRRGLTGARFIQWCDEQLQAEGVQAVYHHVKAEHNFGSMLERMGYELVDLIYARRLDGSNRGHRESVARNSEHSVQYLGEHQGAEARQNGPNGTRERTPTAGQAPSEDREHGARRSDGSAEARAASSVGSHTAEYTGRNALDGAARVDRHNRRREDAVGDVACDVVAEVPDGRE